MPICPRSGPDEGTSPRTSGASMNANITSLDENTPLDPSTSTAASPFPCAGVTHDSMLDDCTDTLVQFCSPILHIPSPSWKPLPTTCTRVPPAPFPCDGTTPSTTTLVLYSNVTSPLLISAPADTATKTTPLLPAGTWHITSLSDTCKAITLITDSCPKWHRITPSGLVPATNTRTRYPPASGPKLGLIPVTTNCMLDTKVKLSAVKSTPFKLTSTV